MKLTTKKIIINEEQQETLFACCERNYSTILNVTPSLSGITKGNVTFHYFTLQYKVKINLIFYIWFTIGLTT